MGYSLLSPIPGLPRITSGYGLRNGKFHRGNDIARPPERMQPLYHMRATVKGTLYRYYEANGFGRYVYIKCDDGFGIIAAHLDAYGAPNGARVDRNTIIGYMGASGNVTGPHTHVELHKRFGGGFNSSNAVNFIFNRR